MRVLVIEDNKGDYYLIEDFLHEAIKDVKIDHVTTFEGAKEILSQNKDYSSILLDLSLPDCSGEELVLGTIDLVPAIPVIVLTGFSDRDFSVKTLSLGVSDYLLKDELSATQLNKSIFYSIERKRISSQLQDSEEKYRHLFNFSPMPMWVYDLSSLRFLNVNDSAVEHYGYSREEFLNMTLYDIRPPEDFKILEKAVHENEIPYGFNKDVYRHKKKNGEVFEVEIQSNIIYFEGKESRLVLATDVSDRMEYIRAIEEQNYVMREIAWTQSHIVRAPLARIMGLVNILGDNNDVEDKSKVINYILDSAKELDHIVRDIVRKTERVDNKIK